MNISKRIESVPPSTIMELLTYAARAKKQGKKVYHLNIGQPDIITPVGFFDAVKNFDKKVLEFKKIVPYDYQKMIDLIASYEKQGLSEDQAKIEAFYAARKG